MPTIRANTAVDPSQISSAFDGLAKALGPATPQEILAGAKARETLQKVQGIKDLYDYAGSAGFDQGLLDRRASIYGMYAPSQSLTAVDRNNLTSRQNNTADNARAVQTNAADNTRALTQTGLQQQGETTRTMLAPVSEGATRFVPPSIASAFGVPQQQVGAVKLNEGQTATLPGGTTLAGTPKPESEDQVKARVLAGMEPERQQEVAYGNTPVETVQTPDGQRIMSRLRSLGSAPAPDSAKAQIANYKTPDGKTGTARLDGGRWIDSQSNAALPEGTTTYSATLQGNKDETGLGTTAKNNVEERLVDIANVENTVKSYKALLDRDPGAIGVVGSVRGMGQDIMSVSREAAQLLGTSFESLKKDIAAGRVEPEFAKQFEHYNPNIPQAKLTELLLASQVAKMMDPNGRISNDRMKSVTEGLGGGGIFSNVDKTRANLDGILNLASTQRQLLGGVAPAAAALGQDGRPAPAKAAPAAAPTRRRFNPQTGALE